MKRTAQQDLEIAKLRIAYEEAAARGDVWKMEYSQDGGVRWFDCPKLEPTWAHATLYRRKPEPDKPFRAFVNIYDSDRDGLRRKACHQIDATVLVFRTAHQANEATCGNTAETCAILPADELAKLEREHGEMLAVLKAVDEYRHRNIAELETRWDALCDSIEKAIKQCDS